MVEELRQKYGLREGMELPRASATTGQMTLEI